MHRHPQFKPFHLLRLFMQNKQRSHRALTEVLTVCYRLTASVNIRGEAKTFSESQGWKTGKVAHTPVWMRGWKSRQTERALDYWTADWCVEEVCSPRHPYCGQAAAFASPSLLKPAAPGFARHTYSLIYGKFTRKHLRLHIDLMQFKETTVKWPNAHTEEMLQSKLPR